MVVLLSILLACSSAIPVSEQTLTVACGRCIFGMDNARGCDWAAEFQGHYYLLYSSEIPADHNNHAPDGICNMPRKAVVAGEIKGDALVASRFELLPAENVPENPLHAPGEPGH